MDLLREHILKSLNGGQAFVSIREALDNINPEVRNARANKNLHTIWEELEHMRIAQEDILNYILDPGWSSPQWPEGYWPEPIDALTEEQWKRTFNGFFSDFKKIIKLASDPDLDLLAIIPHTKVHTYLREFLILIEHNAYHAGKIITIRKIFENW